MRNNQKRYNNKNDNNSNNNNIHLISAKRTDQVIVNKNMRNCQIVEFVVLADHLIKLKESVKRDKYQDLTIELKSYQLLLVILLPDGDIDTNSN